MKWHSLCIAFVCLTLVSACGGGGNGDGNSSNGGPSHSLCEQACTNQSAVCEGDSAGFGDLESCVDSCVGDDSANGTQGAECLVAAEECSDVGDCIVEYYENGGSNNGGNADECWPAPPSEEPVSYDDDWTLETTSPIEASGELLSSYSGLLAVDDSGDVFVARVEPDSDSQFLTVHQWSGTEWTELDALESQDNADLLGFIIDDDNRPVVLWGDSAGFDSNDVRMHAWDGSEWTELSEIPMNHDGAQASNMDLTLDSHGSITVLGTVDDPDGGISAYQLAVYQWDGSAWNQLGEGGLSGTFASGDIDFGNSGITSAADGSLYVTWANSDENDDTAVYVDHWNGDEWQPVGSEAAFVDDHEEVSIQDVEGAAAIDGDTIYLRMTVDANSTSSGMGVSPTLLLAHDGSQWTH